MAGVFAMNDDEINSLSGRLYDVSWALDELDMPTNPGSGPMGSLGLSNSLDTFISEGDRRIDTWKVILGVSWVISGRRYYDGPPPWGIMGVKETSP